jgi:ubiquitin carboxyl-terminal hydrolase 5/13
VVLKIKKTERETPPPSSSDEPPHKITKLAIGVPGGLPLNDHPSFHYHTTVQCLQCNVIIQTEDDVVREAEQAEADKRRAEGADPLPPRVKSPIDKLVDAVLLSTSASSASAVDHSWAGETPQPCEHTLTLSQVESPPSIGSKGRATCSQCELTTNLWLCLTCGALGCGRSYVDGTGGKAHAVAHHQSTGHPVVVKMGTISAEGTADVFCYACDNTVIDPELAHHMSTFGVDIASQQVTEKSTAQLEVDANLTHNWSIVLNEGGNEAVLRYGQGYAGLRNLGNSCYASSVLQVLFHLPSFHRRYWEEGKRHVNECRNGRPADCFQCQMHKVADGIYSGKYALVPSEEQLEDARREREEREAEKERARNGGMEVGQSEKPTRTHRRKKQVSAALSHLLLCCIITLISSHLPSLSLPLPSLSFSLVFLPACSRS